MDLKSADPSPPDELDIDGDLPLEDSDIVFEFEEITDSNDPAAIRAEADFAAGRFLTNDQMRAWLKSWSGKGPLPPYPRPWLK